MWNNKYKRIRLRQLNFFFFFSKRNLIGLRDDDIRGDRKITRTNTYWFNSMVYNCCWFNIHLYRIYAFSKINSIRLIADDSYITNFNSRVQGNWRQRYFDWEENIIVDFCKTVGDQDECPLIFLTIFYVNGLVEYWNPRIWYIEQNDEYETTQFFALFKYK